MKTSQKKHSVMRRNLSAQRTSTVPHSVPKSLRGHLIDTTTSMPAGRVVPIAATHLHREDSVQRGFARFAFEMHETADLLNNAVFVNVKAYLVPYLAFERFNGMDELNRSYQGVPRQEGEQPIPFFETVTRGAVGTDKILEHMGLHVREGDDYNTCYIEAYNAIINHRLGNRSPKLLQEEGRDRLDKTLAPAFWKHDKFKHLVADFDQAMIDGEVPLNVVDAQMPVKGIGKLNQHFDETAYLRETGGTNNQYSNVQSINNADTNNTFYVREDPDNPGFPGVFAELQENGITVSLSNIEAAKKTAAFAKLREQYNGHDDEYIIDLLMGGIRIPEQAFNQPILLANQDTVFGMSKRHATDGASLTQSVVNGETFVDIAIRVPPVNTGGIIMIVAECVPDQLWERQADPILSVTSPEQLPEFLRDELDPEKVSIVKNGYVDVDHDTPDGNFAFAPLNHEWDVKASRIGGHFYRPDATAPFNERRQRFWASETVNPKLGRDFYLCTTIHTNIFKDQQAEPFECFARGQLVIRGNTVFGGALREASDNWEQVLAEKPTETIEK